MEDIKLSLSQAGPSGELSIIRVDGVVDTITASELEDVIETLIGQKRHKILVDLGGVEYISSAGWGIFVSKIQEIRDKEGDIKLVNMIPNVYEIYELLEFENIIQAFDTLEQGKSAFNISAVPSSISGERVWKADDTAVAGAKFQSALSPGTKNRDEEPARSGARPAVRHGTPEDLIIGLIIEDPFCSITELAEQAQEVSSDDSFGWWKVWGILRRHGLLRRRNRFRLARKRNRRA